MQIFKVTGSRQALRDPWMTEKMGPLPLFHTKAPDMKNLLVFAAMLLAIPAWADSALPTDSIYQANITLTDQNGHQFTLVGRRGQVQLVSMLYTSCPMVCPMIVDTLKMTRKSVIADSSGEPRILAVSFDPERDDVATLRAFAARRNLNLEHWTLARAEAGDVRTLAALLKLQYRQLPDGNFNHSSELIALDRDGRIAARTTIIGRIDPAFVAKVKELLDQPRP